MDYYVVGAISSLDCNGTMQQYLDYHCAYRLKETVLFKLIMSYFELLRFKNVMLFRLYCLCL